MSVMTCRNGDVEPCHRWRVRRPRIRTFVKLVAWATTFLATSG
jgi:hypothetical protein